MITGLAFVLGLSLMLNVTLALLLRATNKTLAVHVRAVETLKAMVAANKLATHPVPEADRIVN